MAETVIISGVKGQDGSYLAEKMLRQGKKVLGLTRDPGVVYSGNISHLKKDIELRYISYDYHSIYEIIKTTKPSAVYNLAGQPYVLKSWEMIDETIASSGLIPCHFLKVISEFDRSIKFFQASSSEIFAPDDGSGLTEESKILPRTPYGCAKALAHNMVASYRENYGMFAVNGILFNHESPRRGENFLSRKVVREAVKIKKGLANELTLGNLTVQRDWGYAPDYMNAVVKTMECRQANDFNISTGITHSVEDMVRIVFEILSLDYKKYVKINQNFVRPFEPKVCRGIPDRAKDLLGWSAKTTFKEMLKILINEELKKEN